jgi:hypothetical protein
MYPGLKMPGSALSNVSRKIVERLPGKDRMRIRRSARGEVVFTLSGQMDDEPIAELETLISSEANGSRIVLDLKDVTLVNESAITFLIRCEANSITLKNCPAYVREWINAQPRES